MGAIERSHTRKCCAPCLERSHRERKRVADVFDEVFEEFCREANVPDGYRTEAVRLELLHNLEMIEADSRLVRGVTSLYEEPFRSKWRTVFS